MTHVAFHFELKEKQHEVRVYMQIPRRHPVAWLAGLRPGRNTGRSRLCWWSRGLCMDTWEWEQCVKISVSHINIYLNIFTVKEIWI